MDSDRCHRCGQRILVGLSNAGRCAAQDVRLDPEALTPLMELDALHSGRLSWTMHPTGDVFRRTAQIISRPRLPRTRVLADHACGKGEQ